MNLVGVESNGDFIAGFCKGRGIDAGGEVVAFAVEVEIGLGAHELGNFNLGLDKTVGHGRGVHLLVVDMLGTDTHDNRLVFIGNKAVLLFLEAGSLILYLTPLRVLVFLGTEFGIEGVALFAKNGCR